MIMGMGIDLVSIRRVRSFLENELLKDGFLHYTFTERELASAAKRKDPAEYLAARFAVKEAFFKAVSPISNGLSVDIRNTECLNREDGSPYITEESIFYLTQPLSITKVHVSISTEDDYAVAEVIVEG